MDRATKYNFDKISSDRQGAAFETMSKLYSIGGVICPVRREAATGQIACAKHLLLSSNITLKRILLF